MVWTVEEEFQKNKNMMRLERSGSVGMGICVWRKKKTKRKKKEKKRKRNVWTDGEEVKRIKITIKCYYNIFTIFHNKF